MSGDLIVRVAIDCPLDRQFDYLCPEIVAGQIAPCAGDLVRVDFGNREVTGLITALIDSSDVPPERMKPILSLRRLPRPLNRDWLELCSFAADYYQRPFGEVALPALPKSLRTASDVALKRAVKKIDEAMAATADAVTRARNGVSANGCAEVDMPTLNAAQQSAVDAIVAAHDQFAPFLLHGVTGSGKTEVYLRATQQLLEKYIQQGLPGQVLILIPEINLTPQLESHLRRRFPELPLVTLHSGMAEGERLRAWLSAHLGHARIVLGTRLSVLASLPAVRLIIVDEEHDTSYKQQEGLRYSARDLAIWRARHTGIPIVLGSATPSLESWHHAQTGRYRLLQLAERAVPDAVLPTVRMIDTSRQTPADGLTPELSQAIAQRLERGEQSLLFLNRRGYAPVIACDACGWISNCQRCSAFMVLHTAEKRLRCHHCSLELAVPRSCPTCGNIDLQPLGRGTQRLEEALQMRFPDARLLRIDADSTRFKGSAQEAFDKVHAGEVDILIGTQMVAKGHDFHNLTLVGVVNPDTALFSQDYRASERLFQQLMQVAGRAGRHSTVAGAGEVLIQTRYPQHPLYLALKTHAYAEFATGLLQEREQASLSPFIYQALLRAQAPLMAQALDFLQQATTLVPLPENEIVVLQDPIPMSMARVANQDRAQLLIESASRSALQRYLTQLNQALAAQRGRVKWSLEVDPHDI